MQYVADKTRVIVKVVGEFDITQTSTAGDDDPSLSENDISSRDPEPLSEKQALLNILEEAPVFDVEAYRPKVVDRLWTVSETDLEWMTTGCNILGTGGGGTPYPAFLQRECIPAGVSPFCSMTLSRSTGTYEKRRYGESHVAGRR
jgi:hypothetical protein